MLNCPNKQSSNTVPYTMDRPIGDCDRRTADIGSGMCFEEQVNDTSKADIAKTQRPSLQL